MKIQPFNVILSCVNLALLLSLILWARPVLAQPQDSATTLRGNALELVDAQGQVRTRIKVEPDGEVVLRLFDQQGTIRVKLGASRDGSGLVLLNEGTEPGVQVLAKSAGSSIKLRNRDGKEELIAP